MHGFNSTDEVKAHIAKLIKVYGTSVAPDVHDLKLRPNDVAVSEELNQVRYEIPGIAAVAVPHELMPPVGNGRGELTKLLHKHLRLVHRRSYRAGQESVRLMLGAAIGGGP